MAQAIKAYTPAELNALSEDEVWQLPLVVGIHFDNGKRLLSKKSSMIYSWYQWGVFRKFPGAKILPKHHIGNKQYTKATHTRVADEIIESVLDLDVNDFDLPWKVANRHYNDTNDYYNAQETRLAHFASSIDILDLIAIVQHPLVIEAKARHTEEKITAEQCNKIIYSVMECPNLLAQGNQIVAAVRAGILDVRQITQAIGPRLIRDINGITFTEAVQTGYVEGYERLYDKFIESRLASVAAYMVKTPLEISEYNNRCAQLACGVLIGVNYTSCDSTSYIDWTVEERDLKMLTGKIYVEDGKEIMIRRKSTHLIGRDLKLRHIGGCKTSHTGKPCVSCIGYNGRITPPNAAFGHHNILELTKDMAQTILGTKHVLASAIESYLNIGGDAQKFMLQGTGIEARNIQFNPQIKFFDFKVRFLAEDAVFINDIREVEDASSIRTTQISSVGYIQLVYSTKGKPETSQVIQANTSVGGYGTPLSSKMLAYMRQYGWETIGKFIEIDMAHWDTSDTFMETLPRGNDIMGTVEDFSAYITSTQTGNRTKLSHRRDYADGVKTMHHLLHGRLNYSMSQLETFVYALSRATTVRAGGDRYRLPELGEPYEFIGMKEAIIHRGHGSANGFEDLKSTQYDPSLNVPRSIPAATPLDGIWN